jgi:hypothetical protein
MPLFQQSVLKKYISDIDKAQLQAAWQLFQEHFFNPAIQQNIRNSKEEEYQEGFVRDLFVNVFGYTLNPQPDYNFVLEKESVTVYICVMLQMISIPYIFTGTVLKLLRLQGNQRRE